MGDVPFPAQIKCVWQLLVVSFVEVVVVSVLVLLTFSVLVRVVRGVRVAVAVRVGRCWGARG